MKNNLTKIDDIEGSAYEEKKLLMIVTGDLNELLDREIQKTS